MNPVVSALILWMLFTVLFGLFPIAINAYRRWVNAEVQGQHATWLTDSINDGELFLIATLLNGGGTAHLLTAGPEFETLRYGLGFLSAAQGVVAGVLYADMTAPNRRPRIRGTRLGRNLSIAVFFGSVLVGGLCLFLAEISR